MDACPTGKINSAELCSCLLLILWFVILFKYVNAYCFLFLFIYFSHSLSLPLTTHQTPLLQPDRSHQQLHYLIDFFLFALWILSCWPYLPFWLQHVHTCSCRMTRITVDRPAITKNRSQSQQRELEARDMVTWHTITRHNRLGVWGMWNVRGERGRQGGWRVCWKGWEWERVGEAMRREGAWVKVVVRVDDCRRIG